MHPQLRAPLKLTASVTNTCHLDCRYCYSDCTRTPDPRELTTEQWFKLIDDLVASKVVQIFFEGGEPFHRPDFMEILRYCSRKMMIIVRTFGNHVTPDIARQLKSLKVGLVCVDLLGARAATHDAIVEHTGSHAKSIEGIRNLVAAGVPVFTLMILNRRNVGELQEYVELAAALKARKASVLRLYPLGRAKHRWDELSLSLDEMMAALAAVRVPDGITFMHSWHPNDGNTCYQMSAISAFGDSIGCPYLREYVNLGNIRDIDFTQTWDHPLWQRLRSGIVVDSCATCHDTQGSNGGCRATAFAYHGRWDAPDPFCAEMNGGVDLRQLPHELFAEPPWGASRDGSM